MILNDSWWDWTEVIKISKEEITKGIDLLELYDSVSLDFFQFINKRQHIFLKENIFENTFDSYIKESKKASVNYLKVDKPVFIPTNIYIRFLITSEDVIHSWAIPSLGVKVDACPGRINSVYTKSEWPFTIHYGQCSEICGQNHWGMPITVISIPSNFFIHLFLYK